MLGTTTASYNRVASTPGSAVWSRIVSELARLQDAASAESRQAGAVVNPICGAPNVLDTCCAAVVFAAEYRRTEDQRWHERAVAAVRAAQSHGIFRGIDEPTWSALGWHDAPESLPVTGMVIDAYCDALNRLDLPGGVDQLDGVIDLLSRCRTGRGGFVHNPPQGGQPGTEVQNATATALHLLERFRGNGALGGHVVGNGLEATISRLGRGQSASGFWPYRYPGARWKERLDRRGLNRLLRPRSIFRYNRGGDITHHLMTLYFGARGLSFATPPRGGAEMLAAGWGWIRKRLVRDAQSGVSIEWSTDPTPAHPQFSNARDTNAYFLILGVIPVLDALGVVDPDESGGIARGLMAHIESRLTSADRTPCIVPYEGPVEIVRNILPQFEQSVAWKGRLMASTVSP